MKCPSLPKNTSKGQKQRQANARTIIAATEAESMDQQPYRTILSRGYSSQNDKCIHTAGEQSLRENESHACQNGSCHAERCWAPQCLLGGRDQMYVLKSQQGVTENNELNGFGVVVVQVCVNDCNLLTPIYLYAPVPFHDALHMCNSSCTGRMWRLMLSNMTCTVLQMACKPVKVK